jgi:hypothetical protein
VLKIDWPETDLALVLGLIFPDLIFRSPANARIAPWCGGLALQRHFWW